MLQCVARCDLIGRDRKPRWREDSDDSAYVCRNVTSRAMARGAALRCIRSGEDISVSVAPSMRTMSQAAAEGGLYMLRLADDIRTQLQLHDAAFRPHVGGLA